MAEKARKNIQSDLDKANTEFEKFDENVKELTLDRMNEAPEEDRERSHKLSQKELEKTNVFYLKPKRSLDAVDQKTGQAQKFNEKYRKDWEFLKERVDFIAENREIKDEPLELWTRPMGGVPAEFWEIPANRPVNGPRYVAEQIKRKKYHRLVMHDKAPSNLSQSDGNFGFTGAIAVDSTIQRLDAYPVSTRKSVFMGETHFR